MLALIMALTVSAYADEYFYATANTGTQNAGSVIDISNNWPWGNPGDPGATFSSGSYASNWVLQSANWGTGVGYATLDIDTNHSPGTYYAGTVNCTGQSIWVVLQ